MSNITYAEMLRIDEMDLPTLRAELRETENVKQCAFEAGYGKQWVAIQAHIMNQISHLTGGTVRISYITGR